MAATGLLSSRASNSATKVFNDDGQIEQDCLDDAHLLSVFLKKRTIVIIEFPSWVLMASCNRALLSSKDL